MNVEQCPSKIPLTLRFSYGDWVILVRSVYLVLLLPSFFFFFWWVFSLILFLRQISIAFLPPFIVSGFPSFPSLYLPCFPNFPTLHSRPDLNKLSVPLLQFTKWFPGDDSVTVVAKVGRIKPKGEIKEQRCVFICKIH